MKILLVDGNSILNRGFYALPLLADSNGVFTNAVLGFCNILFKVMEDEKPDYLTVAFDVHAPTFRHRMYEGYKGTRKPMPEELKMQLPIIREVLASMNVNIVEMEGYEADDLLGTLAVKCEKDGLNVTLLSGDRDLLQIASDKIKIAIPKTSKGKTETHLYYSNDVLAEYGVTPTEFIEVKALQGDSSDNIPGVPGVGPKTAAELIQKYKTLENIYENISDITKKALLKNLTENKEQAFFSRVLSRIEINSPIEPDYEKSANHDLLNETAVDVLLKYSLKSVLTKLENLTVSSNDNALENKTLSVDYKVIEDFNETIDVLTRMSKCKTAGVFATEDGVSVSFDNYTYFIRLYGFVTKEFLGLEISKAVGKVGKVITLGVKSLYEYIDDYYESIEDCEILAYLIDPNKGEYNISDLCVTYLSEYYGTAKEISSSLEKLATVVSAKVEQLFDKLYENVERLNMTSLYREIEMPLSFVLYSMEKEGVLVNPDALISYSKSLKNNISLIEERIYDQSGVKFNINSPKQLGEILFEKLGLPGGKKTKSGYSTAADVLDKLSLDYPIVKDILEFRMLSKLNSTYAEGLQSFISSDGRIHAHFNQTITATGRLSSTEPNLQNIPIRTELGRELRKVFYPKEGFSFVDADYSQIELRLMAHMSDDDKMLKAFSDGLDIHRSTASNVFNIPFDEVTSEQRRNAKAVNFGIIYGISAFGLSQDIGTDVKIAKHYIDDYFAKYPKIDKYIKNTVDKAKEDGFTKTLYGRIRPIPELKDSNFMRRSFGERVAMNAPLQGTAADIMKLAMIGIFRKMKSENLSSKMIIQVHDEVLIEAKNEELDRVLEIVKEEMENAASLNVKLEVEAKIGNNWYDAH